MLIGKAPPQIHDKTSPEILIIVASFSYLDPSWGFAMGWNYTLGAALTVCAEVSAAILLIQYWNDTV